MRRPAFLPRLTALVFGLLGLGFLPAPIAGGLGVAQAEAKAYYTRKRVNGVWIEGRFPKSAFRSRRPAGGRRLAAAGVGAIVTPALAKPTERLREPVPEPAAVPTTGTVTPPKSDGGNLSKLQDALERRASEVRGQGAVPVTTPPATATRSEPKSVSLDFETGIKTTVYAGNVSVRESFDLSAAKALASPPPAAGVIAPPSVRAR